MSRPTMGLIHNLQSCCTSQYEDAERAVGRTGIILAEPSWG